jgi:DNA-binding response OmpR family regulator
MRPGRPIASRASRHFVSLERASWDTWAADVDAIDLVRVLYARAPVQVLLVQSEVRGMAFVRELFADLEGVAIRAVEAAEVPLAVVLTDMDLVVVARDTWNDDDTALCGGMHAARLAVPVLAISGPCDTRLRAAALRAGADDFLVVPFEVEELVARAFALVRRAASSSRHARSGVFSVDFARHQISIEGVSLPLTLREYDLLAKLIERAGEVVTRSELSSLSASAGTNVVDVHMSHIRDKLGKHAAHIETVRGIGYRLR